MWFHLTWLLESPPCPQLSPESPDHRELVHSQYPKLILGNTEHHGGRSTDSVIKTRSIRSVKISRKSLLDTRKTELGNTQPLPRRNSLSRDSDRHQRGGAPEPCEAGGVETGCAGGEGLGDVTPGHS